MAKKKEEPKENITSSELVSSTFRTATFVEQKPVSPFEEIAPQTTASTSIENPAKTEALETVKVEPIQPEAPQTPVKVEPSPEKGPELLQMSATGQETIQAYTIQEQSSPSEVKAAGTRRRRSTGTQRRRSKKQESETPQQ